MFMKNGRTLLCILLLLTLFFSVACNVETQGKSSQTSSEKVVETEPTEPATDDAPTEKTTEKIVPYEEIKDTIRIKYFNSFSAGMSHAKTSDELEVQFLGQFGNSIALHVLEDKYHLLLNYPLFSHMVEGYEFRFEDIRKVYIYNDGRFLPLETALNGYITVSDLATIHAEFKRLNPRFYKNPVDEEITSIQTSLVPNVISIKMQPQYNDKDYTAEDFSQIDIVNFRDKGKKDDLSQIYARYEIDLNESVTMDEAIEICRILEQRDDIYAIWFPFVYGD